MPASSSKVPALFSGHDKSAQHPQFSTGKVSQSLAVGG